MTKYKFIIIGILLLGLLTLINFNIKNIYGTNSETDFQSGSIAENIDKNSNSDFIYTYRALTQDDIYALSQIPQYQYSNWLRITDFNFNLPDNSIINGIEVQIDDWGFFMYAIDCYLVLNGNSIGIDKETSTSLKTFDDDTYRTYGSSTDMWNTELIKSDIESSTFGFQISYENKGFLMNNVAVDHIQIKIYYSIPDVDSKAPTWDTLIESNDPLELGNNEIISINVYDDSTIDYVYLEFGSINYSMVFISGNTYRYSNWIPITIGIKYYKIYMNDIYNNINETNIQNITVQDTTKPIISNIIESDDPLELGNTEIIQCDIFDYSNIEFVYLEFENSNYSMIFISGITWKYDSWIPIEIGNYSYVIYAKDIENNIDFNSNNYIIVIDVSNIDFIIVFSLLGIFSIMILILMFSILIIKR